MYYPAPTQNHRHRDQQGKTLKSRSFALLHNDRRKTQKCVFSHLVQSVVHIDYRSMKSMHIDFNFYFRLFAASVSLVPVTDLFFQSQLEPGINI